MPHPGREKFQQLAERFINDLEQCSANVIVSHLAATKPARLQILHGDSRTNCLLFLWNITPGGGASDSRPAHERRIQVTTTKTFPLEPGIRTIIGGWCEETSSWGFWDVHKHTSFSENSPSFQVSVHTLTRAFEEGVATQERKRRNKAPEIVVAVSPGFLLWYVEDGLDLHLSGNEALEVNDLLTATPEEEREFLDNSIDSAQGERRYKVVQTVRAIRSSKFRPDVLRAYRHQCAACQISLNLVEAAHIVPVGSSGSSDEVTNGIALCKLHHAAYDGSLIGIRSDFRIVYNPQKIERLTSRNLHIGLDLFEQTVPGVIRLPNVQEVRPNPAYLRRGMVERKWPEDLIA